MNLRVAIGKGEPCSAIMVGGWRVPPAAESSPVGVVEKIAVIDAIGMLIEGDKKVRRIRSRAQFEKLSVGLKEMIVALVFSVTRGRTEWSKVTIHRHGSQTHRPPCGHLCLTEIPVCRTLVDADIASNVLIKQALFDQVDVGNLRLGGPVHIVVDPISICPGRDLGIGFRLAKVVNHALVIVTCVLQPAKHELLGVTHTQYPLRLGFGSRKCWQEHAGKARDDGDDNQEFDQRESVPSAYPEGAWPFDKVMLNKMVHSDAGDELLES